MPDRERLTLSETQKAGKLDDPPPGDRARFNLDNPPDSAGSECRGVSLPSPYLR